MKNSEISKIKLQVISPPPQGSCAVIKIESNDGRFFKGRAGDSTLCCGSCGNILAENVFREQIRSVVLLCKCGSCNIVPFRWSYRLVDIKDSYNFYFIVMGVILIIADKMVSNIFGGIGFWIGIIFAIFGTIMTLFWTKKIKYFE